MLRRTFLMAPALLGCSPAARAQNCLPNPPEPMQRLSQAQAARDLEAVRAAVAAVAPDGPPRPETPDDLRPLSYAAQAPGDRDGLIARYLRNAERVAWWRTASRPAPPDIPAPLRLPARLISGLLLIADFDRGARARAIALATEAGDYLIACSHDARFDGAPFPYWRGRDGRLGELSERAARMMQRCGRLERALRNGWLVIEEAPQEYFFDTGLVGEAYVALYRSTRETRFRDAALRAATWAQSQPLATNWNYNAFLAGFFAELSTIGESAHWRDRAAEWLRFGVIPGMIPSGPYAGHFVDPHNERLVYRVIMARSLLQSCRVWRAQAGDQATLAELESAARLVFAAIEDQMHAAGGFASASGMAELYGELALAREAPLNFEHAALRNAVRNHLLASAASDRHAPDAGVAHAIRLSYT